MLTRIGGGGGDIVQGGGSEIDGIKTFKNISCV